MKTNAQEYSWFNDLVISTAGCVTVVPAANHAGVLAAFGAIEDSARPVESLDVLGEGIERLPEHWVYVVHAGEALIVVEDNGFQGVRPEVLGPASKASDTHKAAAFFWNVESLTDFSAARRGKIVCSVELIGAEDEDLSEVPKRLQRLVVEGGSDGGDMLGAGGALVAAYADVGFTKETLDGGTFYEIELPASPLATFERDYEYVYAMPDVATTIEALSPAQQRRFAEWVTVAAVREADIAVESPVQRVLAELRTGQIPALHPSLDALARRTAKTADEFSRLADDLDTGGIRRPEHPFYEATAETMFGVRKEISHLEGRYLSQRRSAVEAVRYVTHDDPFSAAVGCLSNASAAYANGRTTRGGLFEENESGRYLKDYEPNPRHIQFTNVVADLLAALVADHDGGDSAEWAQADNGLPPPLSPDERTAAIVADGQAALNGDFDTFQVESSVSDVHEDQDGWSVEGEHSTRIVMYMDDSDNARDDETFGEVPIEFLAEEVSSLEVTIRISTDPQRFFDILRESESFDACVAALRETFDLDDRQALMALYSPTITLTDFGVADVRARHAQAEAQLRTRQQAQDRD